ncbi:sugar transferase [Patescibacteria group bacterium]|nr:sugar transferase [Patescibacteria group bacterium]HOM77751.1 sugar transferase [bacterium]
MTFYHVGKRLLDIFGSIFCIVIFSPIMILTAIHIKRVSPEGPVLADIPLRQGKGGKEFRFLKFRSMIPNAHQWLLDHPDIYEKYKCNNFKIGAEEDPRIIPGGVFMRKYSVDELPQFFNVLMGDMSLVGPRAYYPFEVKTQLEKFPDSQKYMEILKTVKPGITGTWQVSGRSDIDFLERVRMDAEYAQKNSLLYDIWVLLQTPYVVLTKKGAK